MEEMISEKNRSNFKVYWRKQMKGQNQIGKTTSNFEKINITIEELEEVIQKTKIGKAPGNNEITTT